MNAPYQYWLVRYVPDVARGERVNVAVIAGRDGGDWAIRVVQDLKRASRLGGEAGALRPWLESLESTVSHYQNPPLSLFGGDRVERLSTAWVELLSHRFNNVLQISEAAPVLADSARAAADFLFPILVAAPKTTKRSRTRTRLVSNMNEFYLSTGEFETGRNLLRRPFATIGRQRGRFDFAVLSGDVGQLSQAFAFDVRDSDLLEQEIHSWNYIVSKLRNDGGVLTNGQSSAPSVPADVPISVVYQEPNSLDSRHQDMFAAALEAWTDLEVRAVPSAELDQVAIEASRLVHR